MRHEHRRLTHYVSVLGLILGSCSGETVSVGSELGDGLDQCLGTTCASTASQPFALGEGSRCPEEPSATLTRAYQFDVQKRLCKAPWQLGCTAGIQRVRAAPDGSVWLTSTLRGHISTEPEQSVLWLGHLAPDGADLGFFKVASLSATKDTQASLYSDLAIDAEGHVYVVSSSVQYPANAPAKTQAHNALSHYDPEGRPLDGVTTLPGMRRAHLALAGDGRLVVAGQSANDADHGVVALFERDGRLVWSQSSVPSWDVWATDPFQVARDNGDGIAVYSMRRRPDDTLTVGVTRLDAQGGIAWDRFVDGWMASTVGAFGMDAAGNSTLAVSPVPADGMLSPHQVASLDAMGALRWHYEVQEGLVGNIAVAPGGDVFMRGDALPDPVISLPLFQLDSVLRIVADGSRCERYSHPQLGDNGGNYWQSLELGPDGALYIVGVSALVRLENLPAD